MASTLARVHTDNRELNAIQDNVQRSLNKLSLDTSVSPAFGVATKTAAYTLLDSDDLILADASGGAFTLALPPASGTPGKFYYLKKTDSSFNAVTLRGDATETIDGAGSTALNTQNETLQIVSDGSHWWISEKRIPGTRTAYTPVTGGIGTATAVTFEWWRAGQNLWVQGTLTAGTVTGATFSIGLPTGLVVDSFNTDFFVAGALSTNNATACYSYVALSAGGYTSIQAGAKPSNTSNQLAGVAANVFLQTGNKVSMCAEVPIAGWKA